MDFFSHSGTTLLSAEITQRKCITMDIDPIFCEITIRRLEHFRSTGRLGWQNGHAFEEEFVCPEEQESEEVEDASARQCVAQPSLF